MKVYRDTLSNTLRAEILDDDVVVAVDRAILLFGMVTHSCDE